MAKLFDGFYVIGRGVREAGSGQVAEAQRFSRDLAAISTNSQLIWASGHKHQNWLVGHVAILLLVLLTSACAPAPSQSEPTPSVAAAAAARSLASIAETAAVKSTPTPDDALAADSPQNHLVEVGTPDNVADEEPAESGDPDETRVIDEGLDINMEIDSGTAVSSSPEAADSAQEADSSSENSDQVENSGAAEETPAPLMTLTVQQQGFPTDTLNGIGVDELANISAESREKVKEIFSSGQAKGRYPRNFSKLGDSLIATPSFLTPFDKGLYNLGNFDYLQRTIDYFAGSYERYGVAIKAGLHSWGVFDPMWANKDWCQPNESLIACEFRLNNPSVLLILLGSNDSGAPDSFDYNLRKVVEFSIESGVIPVIATKADRFEGPDNRNNLMLRQIAADYQIPLWDFDLVADTIEGRGLQEDQVHLTEFVQNDYTMTAAFQSGHALHNLTALLMLDKIRQIVAEEID